MAPFHADTVGIVAFHFCSLFQVEASRQSSLRPDLDPLCHAMGAFARRSDFGVRPPWPVRVVSLVCYAECARHGGLLLFGHLGRSDAKKTARIGLWWYTFVYGFDSFNAIFLRWIGLQGVHMHHMYEHHLLGCGLGASLCAYVHLNPDIWDSLVLDLCYYPLSVGLLTHPCEIWGILRTFMQEPESRGKKIVQRALGAVLVSALSSSILATLYRYITEFFRKSDRVSVAEAFIVVLSVYLACVVQPSYVWSHLRALNKLTLVTKEG